VSKKLEEKKPENPGRGKKTVFHVLSLQQEQAMTSDGGRFAQRITQALKGDILVIK